MRVGGTTLKGMSRNDRARMRRRSIGFVFQDFNLLAGLTALENVALPLELDGIRAKRAHASGRAALEELGLGDRAERYPDELSGGERQRVAIARAIVGDRHLLLADEPSGALDSVNGEAVMRLMRGACKRGVAGVVVTHDAQLASWADRVVFLRDGRMVDQDRRRCPGPSHSSRHDRRPATRETRLRARRPRAAPRRRLRPAGPPRHAAGGRGGCFAGSGASSCSCSPC